VSGPIREFVGGGPMDGGHWHRPFSGAVGPARIAFAHRPQAQNTGSLVHQYESAHDGAPWAYQGNVPWDRRTELCDLAHCLPQRGPLP
jgi:hypothetical protein